MDFKGRGLRAVERQAVGPKETFARSQLAALSLIFIDFIGFLKILWISIDFKGRRFADDYRPICPNETFVRSQPAAISLLFIDFNAFHKISCFSKDCKSRM